MGTKPKSTVDGMIRSNDEFVSGLPLKSFHVSQAIDSHDESVMSRAAPLVKEWAKGPRMSQDVPGKDQRTMVLSLRQICVPGIHVGCGCGYVGL